MAHDFGNLLLDGHLKDLSDVELLVGPTKVSILAHKVQLHKRATEFTLMILKAIICARCPKFAGMFRAGRVMLEGRYGCTNWPQTFTNNIIAGKVKQGIQLYYWMPPQKE